MYTDHQTISAISLRLYTNHTRNQNDTYTNIIPIEVDNIASIYPIRLTR